MKHKQLRPMIAPASHPRDPREAADSAPATTVSSPLAENAPASNPIAGSLGLLRRAIHSNSATSIGGRGRSRPTTPPPGGFGASLPHSNNNNNLPPSTFRQAESRAASRRRRASALAALVEALVACGIALGVAERCKGGGERHPAAVCGWRGDGLSGCGLPQPAECG